MVNEHTIKFTAPIAARGESEDDCFQTEYLIAIISEESDVLEMETDDKYSENFEKRITLLDFLSSDYKKLNIITPKSNQNILKKRKIFLQNQSLLI